MASKRPCIEMAPLEPTASREEALHALAQRILIYKWQWDALMAIRYVGASSSISNDDRKELIAYIKAMDYIVWINGASKRHPQNALHMRRPS